MKSPRRACPGQSSSCRVGQERPRDADVLAARRERERGGAYGFRGISKTPKLSGLSSCLGSGAEPMTSEPSERLRNNVVFNIIFLFKSGYSPLKVGGCISPSPGIYAGVILYQNASIKAEIIA